MRRHSSDWSLVPWRPNGLWDSWILQLTFLLDDDNRFFVGCWMIFVNMHANWWMLFFFGFSRKPTKKNRGWQKKQHETTKISKQRSLEDTVDRYPWLFLIFGYIVWWSFENRENLGNLTKTSQLWRPNNVQCEQLRTNYNLRYKFVR